MFQILVSAKWKNLSEKKNVLLFRSRVDLIENIFEVSDNHCNMGVLLFQCVSKINNSRKDFFIIQTYTSSILQALKFKVNAW